MNFIKDRLNRDNFFNIVFWLGMTAWVTLSMPQHPLLALSSIVGMPFLIRKLSPLKVVEVKLELILEYPDSLAVTANAEQKNEEKKEKKELPAARECLANSKGEIVSDGAPYLFLAAFSPFAVGIPLLFVILDKTLNSMPSDIAGPIAISIFFLIPVSIFILYNRPISLLFDWRAWYLQGWRQLRPTLHQYMTDPIYSNWSGNIYHRR